MKKYPLIIITVLAFLLPAIWLNDQLVIAYAESGSLFFLADPQRVFTLTSSTWWDKLGFGVDNIRALPLSSYFLLASVLKLIGLSPLVRQYLIFAAILLLSGLSKKLVKIHTNWPMATLMLGRLPRKWLMKTRIIS